MRLSSEPSFRIAFRTPSRAMSMLLLMGFLVALFPALACSAQQPATPTGSSEDQPRSGGVLKVLVMGTVGPNSLDPIVGGSLTNTAALDPTYGKLVRIDAAKSLETNVLAPDLAERWETSGDGKTLTFYLRKNAKWQDGTPVTAADVKYTLDRILDPKDPQAVDMANNRASLERVDRVEVVDDYTVRLLLKAPSNTLLFLLAHGPVRIAPKHAYGKVDLVNTTMGNGPYRFKAYQAGVSLEYERNPDYYLKGLPYLDGMAMYWIRDAAAGAAAFTTKQLDLVRQIEQPVWEGIRKDVPEAKLIPWNYTRPLILGVNLGRKPYDDPRVRQAIFLALDKRTGSKLLAGDWGVVGGYFLPGQWGLPEAELRKMPGYGDPQTQIAEAKKLLADAGYAQGFKANMIVNPSHPYYEAVAIWAKDQLKKNLNIDVSIEMLGTADQTARRDQGTYDMIPIIAANYYTDPAGGERYFGPANFWRFADQEIFDLLAQQDRTLDPTERKKLVNELERKLLERGPYTTITWTLSGSAHYPEVRNHFEPTCLYCNFRYDEVWLAK